MVIAQAGNEASSGAFQLVLIVLVFGSLFLFMSFRQRRQLRERTAFLGTLTVGDRARTFGGVIGTIESIDGDEVVLASEGTRLRVVKAAVAARMGEE